METCYGEYGRINFCPVCKEGGLERLGLDNYFCWFCQMIYRIVVETEAEYRKSKEADFRTKCEFPDYFEQCYPEIDPFTVINREV